MRKDMKSPSGPVGTSEQAAHDEPVYMSPCSILLVEDSADDREMVIGYIKAFDEHQKFTILEAGNIEDGLRLLRQVRTDLVLLDHALPDGTGADFISRALGDTDGRQLPIIMLTGQGNEHIAVDAMRKGASDYLSKNELTSRLLYRAVVRTQKMRELANELAESSHARDVAQMALHQNEVTLQRLVESIHDYAILSLDAYGHVASWNAGARQLFDYHDQDIIGAHLRVLMPNETDSDNDAKAELDKAVRDGTIHAERYFSRRDGSLFWARSTLSPITAANGQLLGFAWVVHLPSTPQTPGHKPHGQS